MSNASYGKKMPRLGAIALFCLSIGLLLPLIIHPTSAAGVDWLHGIRGLLIGFSIGATITLLIRIRQARNCDRQEKDMELARRG